MTREEACERLLVRLRRNKKIIDRLMLWDETKTIHENKKRIGYLNAPSAYKFAKRYGLKFRILRKYEMKNISLSELKKEAYKALVDSGFSHAQVGTIFNVSRQAIHSSILTCKSNLT